MRDARYSQVEDMLTDGSVKGSSQGERGELFLVFTIRPLGLCALPVTAVQAVCTADGPVRRVPLRGGAGSRFLGLVSVRGQVQMLFDLSVVPSLQGALLPPPARDEHLLVAVAADGRTLALRVLPPLRLVRRQPVTETGAKRSAHGQCGSFSAGAFVAGAGIDAGAVASAHADEGKSVDPDDDGILNACDAGISPEDNDGNADPADAASRPKKEHAATDVAAACMVDTQSSDAGSAFAVPVCGSFAMPDAEDEKVWLLCADQLFAQLEAEARHG